MTGAEPFLELAREVATALSLEDRVFFPGAVPPERVRDLLIEADCHVQHSILALSGDSEGSPVVVLEAAAASLPVVATRHAGITESVIDGSTGYLVDEHDVDTMGDRMAELGLDRDRAHRFGHAGRSHMCTHYTLDVSITALALAGLADTLTRHPGAMALCRWFRLEQEAITGRWVRRPGPWSPTPGPDPLDDWLKGRYDPTCAVLWSRSAYEATGGWDESLVVNQNGDLMMRAIIEGIGVFPTSRGEVFCRRLPPGERSVNGRRFSPKGIRSGIRVIEKAAWLLEIREYPHRYAPALAHAFRRPSHRLDQRDLKPFDEH